MTYVWCLIFTYSLKSVRLFLRLTSENVALADIDCLQQTSENVCIPMCQFVQGLSVLTIPFSIPDVGICLLGCCFKVKDQKKSENVVKKISIEILRVLYYQVSLVIKHQKKFEFRTNPVLRPKPIRPTLGILARVLSIGFVGKLVHRYFNHSFPSGTHVNFWYFYIFFQFGLLVCYLFLLKVYSFIFRVVVFFYCIMDCEGENITTDIPR